MVDIAQSICNKGFIFLFANLKQPIVIALKAMEHDPALKTLKIDHAVNAKIKES